ncbi:MAG: YabP/YqfC family sporulation protein, partial [Acutalibacteraceae bacterium]
GIKDVLGFNDDTVNLLTEMGKLVIKGSSLHINKLDNESGEINIDGKISSLTYIGDSQSEKGIKRLFR